MSKKKIAICGMPGITPETLNEYVRVIAAKNDTAQVDLIAPGILPEDELIEKLQGYDILMSGFQPMSDKAYAETKLMAYCACSIGVDFTNHQGATKHGVLVTHNPEYCIDEVAEHVVAFMLDCARGLYKMVPYVKSGNWGFPYLKPLHRFKGSTIGLYGFGRIPRMVAQKLAGFEVNIITCDPYVTPEQAQAGGAKLVSFDELIATSDFISIHAPLTPETQGCINASVFRKMRKNAFIINSARGPVINQEDLYEALQSGLIKGAALDVMTIEPPQEMEKKLIALPNVIVTGHSAFYSDEALELQIKLTAEEIERVLQGQMPKNIVNRTVLDRITWIKTNK